MIGSTGSKDYGLISGKIEVDKLVLKRFSGFNELVFNELHKDKFDFFDFSKSNSWHMQSSDRTADLWDSKYVVVYFDPDLAGHDFELVQDGHTLDIFKTLYELDAYSKVSPVFRTYATEEDETIERPVAREGEDDLMKEVRESVELEVFKSPIIFGTITDWKPM